MSGRITAARRATRGEFALATQGVRGEARRYASRASYAARSKPAPLGRNGRHDAH